jgi:CMP-2-keto-3-deoxyoctulosonic acid synthetase
MIKLGCLGRESLEQLRALEFGMRIDAAVIRTEPLGVDTLADLERAKTLLAVYPLTRSGVVAGQ